MGRTRRPNSLRPIDSRTGNSPAMTILVYLPTLQGLLHGNSWLIWWMCQFSEETRQRDKSVHYMWPHQVKHTVSFTSISVISKILNTFIINMTIQFIIVNSQQWDGPPKLNTLTFRYANKSMRIVLLNLPSNAVNTVLSKHSSVTFGINRWTCLDFTHEQYWKGGYVSSFFK